VPSNEHGPVGKFNAKRGEGDGKRENRAIAGILRLTVERTRGEPLIQIDRLKQNSR
jgi:hypothetical protein